MVRRDAEDIQIETLMRAAADGIGGEHVGAARLLELGRAQAEAGDVLAALTSYRAAAVRDPQSIIALAATAIEALEYSLEPATPAVRKLRLDIALEHASRAIALDPRAARAHSALARVLPERSRAERGGGRGAAMQAILEGFAHARLAVDIDPSDTDALEFVAARVLEWRAVGRVARMAARALLGAGELDATSLEQAARIARRAVSLRPECLRYRLTLARALQATGDERGAREQLDFIMDACPARPSEFAAQQAAARMVGRG